MRQQVNLFQDALRPRRVLWSAKHLITALAAVLVLMIMMEGFGFWQTWSIKQALINSELALKGKQAELKIVETKYPRPQEDQRLVQRVSKLDDEVRQKQQILGILNEGEYGNTRGFADHLHGLSKQHVEGIWLTHLSINQGGKQLGLSGGSLKPELVPKFLQRLGSEPSFAGKEFKSFLLSRAKKTAAWVNFDLNTELKAERQ